MASLPEKFVRTQAEVHGEAGRSWLRDLPELLREYRRRWSLELDPPFPELSYHYVAPGVRADGTAVAIKAGVPHREMRSEIAALRAFDGRGAVRLLEADEKAGVLLLERVLPGTMLAESTEREAPLLAAAAMRRLWRSVPPRAEFCTLEDWVRGFERLRRMFDGGTGPLPTGLVERAERLGEELLASAEPGLIHGDLHHFNLLKGEREPWLAIDPKGLIGDPAYEPAPFLANRTPTEDQGLRRRIDIFASELAIDRERILAWGFVHATMSAWWTIEDHGEDWEPAIDLARRLLYLR